VTGDTSVPTVGSVVELRRYPVKSLAGETLTVAAVDRRGLDGDRRWTVSDADGKFGSSKSTRRFRKMDGLQLTASYDGYRNPIIGFPDGRRISGDDPDVHEALSDHVGRPDQLQPEGRVSHFDEGPLHLITTASLAALADHHGPSVSTARLRANLLVDVGAAAGFVEDGWTGRKLAIGSDLVISIREPMPRCVMVDLAQHVLPPAPGLFDTIGRHNRACVGVVADVRRAGTTRVGDPVRLLDRPEPPARMAGGGSEYARICHRGRRANNCATFRDTVIG
jgi:uncharacterized protein